ncbi:MAG: C40 family peptidase [Gemmatimonadaceae bacterium]|nr:C40 family peptidase [Gemmatimonadaceae bacterium]
MINEQRKTVRSVLAPLCAEPRISSAMTSQLLIGDVVAVVDGRGDWLEVRCADGYTGWVHVGYLTASTGTEDKWRVSLGCRVRDLVGTTRELPLGARLAPDTEVLSGVAVDADARVLQFPPTPAAVAASAERLFVGASYLWGGVTPWGCDCSGFVQRVLWLHGVQLPRDAWQQALVGTRVATYASDTHAPGDLLFFSDRDDRKITHVGLALDAQRMVHCSLTRGGIAVEQLDSSDPYVVRLRAQCIEVRRVL